MPKRIVLVTYGSRGDVQPFLALSRRLMQADYAVRLLAPLMSSSTLPEAGEQFEFIQLEGDIDLLAEDLAQAGLNPLRTAQVMSKFVLPLAVRVYKLLLETCQDAHAIVHSFAFTDGAHQVARRLGVPDISVQFFPVFAPTANFPAMSMPDLRLPGGLTGVYRRWSHAFNTATFRHGGRLMYASLRRKHPSLPALGEWPFDRPVNQRPPLVFAFSPQVVPHDASWPANIQTSGYWFLDEQQDWQPPDELRRFLEAGDPPVYIGFGSMIPRADGKSEKTSPLKMALKAVDQVPGLRAVLALPGASEHSDLPSNVLAIRSVPHSWLFPRMAAVVHHGGAGTTAAGLRAGVPSLIAPFMGDQSFWAQRVVELGVGPSIAPLKHLTGGQLAQALRQAQQDAPMRARAQALGRRIQDEDGLGKTVEIIQKL